MVGEAEKTIGEERKMVGEAEKTVGEERKIVRETEKTIGEVRKTFRSSRSQALLPYCVPSVSAVSNASGRIYNAQCLTGYALAA